MFLTALPNASKKKGWTNSKPQNPKLFPGNSTPYRYFTLRSPHPTAGEAVDAAGLAKAVQDAQKMYQTDRLEEASNQYETITASFPRLPLPAEQAAEVEGGVRAEYRATLYRLNHREAAEKQLELAKQLNPGSAAVAECEGFALVDAGQYEAADKKSALAIAASSAAASQRFLQASRGMTLRQLGRYDEAAAALAAAARASSDTGQKLRYYSLVADCRFQSRSTRGGTKISLRLPAGPRRLHERSPKQPPTGQDVSLGFRAFAGVEPQQRRRHRARRGGEDPDGGTWHGLPTQRLRSLVPRSPKA